MAQREKLVFAISSDGKVAEQELKRLDQAILAVADRADEAAGEMAELQKAAVASAAAAEKAAASQAQASEKVSRATAEQVAAQKSVAAAAKASKDERVRAEKAVRSAAEAAAKDQVAELKRVEEAQRRLTAVREQTGASRKKADVAARAAAAAELKAAQQALAVKQQATAAGLAAIRKEASERKKAADAALRAAKDEARVRTQGVKEAARAEAAAARETNRALREAARSVQTAQGLADRVAAQDDPSRALRSLGVQRDGKIDGRIADIERARQAALRAENLTAQERIRINAAADAHIARERARVEQTSTSESVRAMEALGLRRREQIQKEIAQVREQARIASTAANTTAGERLRIERQTVQKLRALNEELANSTASAFKLRMQSAASGIGNIGQSIRSAGFATSIGVSALAGLGLRAAARDTMSYEQEMQNFKAISPNTTDAEFEALKVMVKDYGRDTSYTTNEVAAAAKMLASNGLSAKQIMDGALEASLAMGVAVDTDLSGAADMVTDAMAQFGKSAKDLLDLADQITGLRANSKMDADGIRMLIGQGGGVSGMSGLSIEDFFAGAAISAPFVSGGSDGGTSFKTMIMRLFSQDSEKARRAAGFSAYTVSDEVAAATSKHSAITARTLEASNAAKERVKQLQESATEKKATAADRAALAKARKMATQTEKAHKAALDVMEKDIAAARSKSLDEDGVLLPLDKIADEIRRVTEGKTNEEASKIVGSIFGQDAVRTALALRDMGGEGVRAMKEKIATGDAKKAEQERLDSTTGQLKLFQSAVEAFSIALMESGLLAAFRQILENATALVAKLSELSPTMLNVIAVFGTGAAVLGPFLMVLGQMGIGVMVLWKAMAMMAPLGAGMLSMFGGLVGAMSSLAGWLARGALLMSGFVAAMVGAPVWVGAAIIAAVVALGAAMWTFRDEIYNAIVDGWQSASDWVVDKWTDLVGWAGDLLASIWKDSWAQKAVQLVSGGAENSVPQFATGVIGLRGPGTSTSDSIPAYLSRGESVITARATRFWGSNLMQGIQNMDPRSVVMPAPAAVPVPMAAGGGARELHPINLSINAGGPISGLFGTPDAVRQMKQFQNRKAVLQPASISRAQR